MLIINVSYTDRAQRLALPGKFYNLLRFREHFPKIFESYGIEKC